MIKDYCDYGKLTFHIIHTIPPSKKKSFFYLFFLPWVHKEVVRGPDLDRGPPFADPCTKVWEPLLWDPLLYCKINENLTLRVYKSNQMESRAPLHYRNNTK